MQMYNGRVAKLARHCQARCRTATGREPGLTWCQRKIFMHMDAARAATARGQGSFGLRDALMEMLVADWQLHLQTMGDNTSPEETHDNA